MTAPLTPPDTVAFQQACRAQAEAADPMISAWVAANAGSGKTKVLIDRVARLLLRGAPPDSILCITYTRAAANEMVDRLFARLGDWSVMDEAQLRNKLAQLEGRTAGEYTSDDVRRARALFAKALETPGGLRIETIHAFCSRVLRRFPLEAGVSPGFSEIEESEDARLRIEAIAQAILTAAPEDRDRVALDAGGMGAQAPLKALMGQGRRTSAFLSLNGEDPGRMGTAIREAIGAPDLSPADILQAAMGDALPVASLREAADILATGGKSEVKTADILVATLEATTPEAAFEAYRPLWRTATGGLRKSNPYNKATPEAAPFIAELFQIKDGEGREITRMLAVERDLIAARCAERTLALLTLGQVATAHFAAAKTARAALDFDDLIARVRSLLTEAEMADWVRFKLDGGLTHLLLDEAQDTSPDQWDIVDALTEEFFAGLGAERAQDPRTVFVVGDEKQSIYAFQGADPDSFLTGRQAFTLKPGSPRSPDMAMSFRSTPEVLDFVDTVFDTGVFDGHPFALNPPPEADAIRHTARRDGQSGRVELWPIVPKTESVDDDPWDAPVDSLSEGAPKAVLAQQIAETVSGMIRRGETVWTEIEGGAWTRRPMRAGDVMILVRSRKGGLFDAIIDALKRNGLPVAGADRLVLADHIGVQDCLNLMRFALLPSDDLTLAEILRGPFCGLVDDDIHLFPLATSPVRQSGGSLWDALIASPLAPHTAAARFLEGLIARRDRPPFELLSQVLDCPLSAGSQTGWTHLLARLGDPARDPVQALLSRALEPPGDGPQSLQHFVSAMEGDETQIKRDLAAAGGEVRVMTIHGAKGLQAPMVILPDTTAPPKPARPSLFMVDGVPIWSPNKALDPEAVAIERDLISDKDLREHRRLLYVALTRAQDRLLIAGAWHGKADPGYAPNSWYALCENALTRLGAEPDGRGVLSVGPVPTTALKAPSSASAQAAVSDASAAPKWLHEPAAPVTGGWREVSPSQLTAERGPIVPPGGAAASRRFKRGRLIHDLLQRLPHLPDAGRDTAANAVLDADTELTADERAEIAKTALATLRHPEFSAVFAPEGRSEAPVIGRGRGWPEGTIINGRVDRLVVTDTDVLIADFKTDRPPPSTPEAVDEAYLRQMAAYQNVLSEAYPGRTVRCALVWTDGPRLMALPDALLLEALNRAQSGL